MNIRMGKASESVVGDASLYDVKPRLFTYNTSHNLYHEGGRKIHITKADKDLDSRALCGYYGPFSISTEIDLDWLKQADPDGNICSKCKKIAERILNEV